MEVEKFLVIRILGSMHPNGDSSNAPSAIPTNKSCIAQKFICNTKIHLNPVGVPQITAMWQVRKVLWTTRRICLSEGQEPTS